jgi:hypothetical protein
MYLSPLTEQMEFLMVSSGMGNDFAEARMYSNKAMIIFSSKIKLKVIVLRDIIN